MSFALAAGAVAFVLYLIPNLDRAYDAALMGRAIILAVVIAALCWATAERAVALTAGAIDAAIARLARAARGDLDSPIPVEVQRCVPALAKAMTDLFGQLDTNLTSIERMALYDVVTGLPNRSHFRRQCEQVLDELAPDAIAALLFIDLDRFKTVNDTLGHAAGDILLNLIAERLAAATADLSEGGPPLIGRLAGDEFTVLLPAVADVAAADRLGRWVHAALLAPYDIHGHSIEIGASLGIALRPTHGRDLTDLMRAADAAMYHAKQSGRGRVTLFDAELAARIAEQADLDTHLRTAVAERQFEMMFQPQIAIGSGAVVAAEALVRWRHPEHGLRLPSSFIPRAEETGLIVDIGQWVVETVTATIARWAADGYAQRMAINVSARQLDHATFFRRLRAALRAAGAPARLLELELTETLAMSCSDDMLVALADLRADGATVSIDNFGTGYSNIARLRRLPIDRVKLDASVIAEVAREDASRAVVHSLIGLIHGLGCEAVAEGVETVAQADVLRVMGCDVIQGYAIAAPMSERDFLAWRRGDQPSARASTLA